MRSRVELFSGVKSHVEGRFDGREINTQPRFQASESKQAGEEDFNVFSFAGGANR